MTADTDGDGLAGIHRWHQEQINPPIICLVLYMGKPREVPLLGPSSREEGPLCTFIPGQATSRPRLACLKLKLEGYHRV